jgi:hypothetical protein
MPCFHVSIANSLWSLYIDNINHFPATIIFPHSLFIFVVPLETMDTGFTVTRSQVTFSAQQKYSSSPTKVPCPPMEKYYTTNTGSLKF